MKAKNWLFLGFLFFFGFIVSSCGDDEEVIVEPGVNPNLGEVQLGDSTVQATVVFTEDELIKALQDTAWVDDYQPYVYDNGKMIQIKTYPDIHIPVIYTHVFGDSCKYNEKMLYTVGNWSATYSVVGNVVKWVYPGGLTREMNVIALDKDRIILDSKYYEDYYYFPEGGVWFNTETANYRFVWRPKK